MDITNKSDGTKLHDLLIAKGIDNSEFFSIMYENGYKSGNTQRKLISKDTITIEKCDLCLICSLFGFGPEDFGYPADYFNSVHSETYVGLHCYNTRREGMKEYRPFLENFDKEANAHLLSATEELLVCDYVDKARGIGLKENVDYYHQKAASFFGLLEERLGKIPSLQYKRIMQVPLGAEAKGFEEGVFIILEELFFEHFAHICRCLKHHSEQCSFIVVNRPFKLHTYFVADNKVALTEYHRYDANGIPTPDMLFVNLRDPHDKCAVGSVYIDSCRDEFYRMMESRFNSECKVTKPKLIMAMFRLEKTLREEQIRIENELRKYETTGIPGISVDNSIRLFDRIAELDKKTEDYLTDWEKLQVSLDSVRRRHQNITEKMKILCDIYGLQPIGTT